MSSWNMTISSPFVLLGSVEGWYRKISRSGDAAVVVGAVMLACWPKQTKPAGQEVMATSLIVTSPSKPGGTVTDVVIGSFLDGPALPPVWTVPPAAVIQPLASSGSVVGALTVVVSLASLLLESGSGSSALTVAALVMFVGLVT